MLLTIAMKVFFYILCLLSIVSSSHLSLISKSTEDISQTTKFNYELIQDSSFWMACSYHFNSTRTLTLIADEIKNNVIYNDTVSTLTSLLVHQLNIPIEVMSTEFFKYSSVFKSPPVNKKELPVSKLEYPPESSHSYLILSSSYKRTCDYIRLNDPTKTEWKTKDNYLVLIILHDAWKMNNIKKDVEIFEAFWNRKILNVMLLEKHLGSMNGEHDSISVYNPLQNTEKKEVIRVELSDFSLLPKTYLERTWKLNNFSLKVTMFESFPNAIMKCEPVCKYTGRDWEVIHNLAEYMNFEPIVFTPTDGGKFGFKNKRGTFTGAMKDLADRTADISGNERYIKFYDTELIAFTMPAFYTKQLVVIVPKAQKLSSWEAVSSSFNFYFWMYLLIVFMTSTVLWYIIRKIHGRVYYISHLLDTMSVFLTMSVNFLTRATSHSQRIFLSFSMLFSLVVMCLIQSSLLDAVAHPHYNRDIKTLAELDNAGLSIVTLDPNLIDTFDESERMRNLSSKLTYMNVSSDTLLQRIILYRNISFLTSNGEAVWFLGKYPNALHIVKEYPREYFVSYMIHKDSPYATRIHNLLGKMSAGGLVLKWDEETRYQLQLEASSLGRNYFQNTQSLKVFKLVDFYLAFTAWGVGILLGFIVLWLENSVDYRMNKYRVSIKV
ncbi:Ionotropic receptor [Blattella germanica]|nr:Ionotropic receptor [Blattella germanica]